MHYNNTAINNVKFFSFFVILVILFSRTNVTASERFAGDFLSLGSGARALGMGETFVAVSEGAVSTYYNPAGLTRLTVKEANLMHSEQFGGLENYNTLSFGAKVSENFYGGIGLVHLGIGDIKYTRLWDPSKALSDSNRAEIASREDAADYAVYFSGARRFSDNLSAGGSVKVIRRVIGPDTAFGFGLDAGLQYRVSDHWDIGVLWRDLTGTTIAWDGYSDDRIAGTLDTGAAFRGTFPWIGGSYVLTASMLFFGDSPHAKGIDTMHIGGEYLIGDIIALRAGSSTGHGTFGLGIKRLPLISSTSLDYAFLSHEELDSTHRLSLTVGF